MGAQGSMTGKVLNGRYEIGERIGIGGMAEVYSAQDTVLGRMVAVKVMLPQFAEDDDFARRFRQEAAAAANLQSPYIVNVYDWGHDLGTYFIVMEYVRGSDLKSAIKQRGAINQRKVAEIASQVCQALNVAHSQDIVHRDIKPQNIMIQPDGNVKVMDFGIARAKNSLNEKTGNVLGTAHYISPEQAQGFDLTNATDIYSLGVVMYEAVTGKLPFDGPDAVSVALMQVKDQPMLPRDINPEVDEALQSIILKAMSKDVNARFATANDMRKALNDYLSGRANPSSFTSEVTRVIPSAAVAPGSTQVMPAVAAEGIGNQVRTYSNEATDKAPMSGKKKAGIALGVIAGLVVIGALIWAIIGGSGDSVEVPDVVGMTTSEATQAIEKAGFSVGTTESVYTDEMEAGRVFKQSPKGKDKAKKGSKINLTVSQGKEQIDVPDVRGMSHAEASNAITQAGFAVGKISEQESDSVESGKVISTDPAGGSKANKGSTINIVISKGAESVSVPNLVGLSISEATSKAQAAGFTIYQSGSDYSSQYAEGLVMSQSPTSGQKASKGSAIAYVVSLGASNVSVPNVVGYTEAGAKSAIESAGLVFKKTTQASSEAAGTVISVNPSAGSSVKPGSSVTVVVSSGPGGSS